MSNTSPYIEEFVAVGINHWNAPVEVRERFSFTNEKRDAFLDDAASYGLKDIVMLSTCNRTELFARTSQEGVLSRFLLNHVTGTPEEFEQYGFRLRGIQALEHFYRVAVGLDAQILGDLQIIKQVKEAYESANAKGLVDSLMHRLMQSVFRTHKRSRNETALASGAATVAYAAVQEAKLRFSSLVDKNIVLVGTGKIGKVTCKNLINLGARKVTLINRNVTRAEKLGNRFDLPVAGFDNLHKHISDADLVIVATGADLPVVRMEHVPPADSGRKLVMLDLSVPRNIDPEIDRLSHVDLINMDMLNQTTDEAYRLREKSIPLVESIISQELQEYTTWLHQQKVVPTIVKLTNKFDDIRKAELERFKNKTGITDTEAIEMLTQRIVNKIAAHSIEHLRTRNGDSEDVARLIQEMFKLESEY